MQCPVPGTTKLTTDSGTSPAKASEGISILLMLLLLLLRVVEERVVRGRIGLLLLHHIRLLHMLLLLLLLLLLLSKNVDRLPSRGCRVLHGHGVRGVNAVLLRLLWLVQVVDV